jgi:hypothetical protein
MAPLESGQRLSTRLCEGSKWPDLSAAGGGEIPALVQAGTMRLVVGANHVSP